MKTVSGEVVSSEPVPLSKAARILSKFVSSDNNGASPAFAAYLRRASASFSELAQLHKEHKRSGSQLKAKKKRSDGVVGERTAESVQNSSKEVVQNKEIGISKRKEPRGVDKIEVEAGRIDVRFNVVEEIKKHKSKNRRDEDEGRRDGGSMEVRNVEGVVDWNVGDVGVGAGKKSKKKQDNTDIVAVTIEDQSYAVYANEVKNETESLDESKERKKKKKRGKSEKAKSDDLIDIEKGMQIRPSSQDDVNEKATQIVENVSDELKKRKKSKKNEIIVERVSSVIKGNEQRNESKGGSVNLENVDKSGEEKKHKKKRTHEDKDRANKGKIEIEAANNKESRKRKHESVAAGEFDGSQEKHKSKKKKR